MVTDIGHLVLAESKARQEYDRVGATNTWGLSLEGRASLDVRYEAAKTALTNARSALNKARAANPIPDYKG